MCFSSGKAREGCFTQGEKKKYFFFLQHYKHVSLTDLNSVVADGAVEVWLLL